MNTSRQYLWRLIILAALLAAAINGHYGHYDRATALLLVAIFARLELPR